MRLEVSRNGISITPNIQDGKVIGFSLHTEPPSVNVEMAAAERELSDWLRDVRLDVERAGRDTDGYYNLAGGLRVRELAGIGCGIDKSLRVLTPDERVSPGFVYFPK